MAEFLKDTAGISFYLGKLIEDTSTQLIIITPYLQTNPKIREALEQKENKDIRVVLKKGGIHPDETSWLKLHPGIRTSYREFLHSKCYINESEAIITSMNLYDYSQSHNDEMGIYVTKEKDPELYEKVFKEAFNLLEHSTAFISSFEIVDEKTPKKETPVKPSQPESVKPKLIENGPSVFPGLVFEKKSTTTVKGHCIRCGKQKTLNTSYPYCDTCFKLWKKSEDPDHKERYCHICGEETAKPTTLNKPACYSCFKANPHLFP